MADLGRRANLGLVQLDPEPWPSQARYIAALVMKYVRVGEIIEQIGALIVVDA